MFYNHYQTVEFCYIGVGLAIGVLQVVNQNENGIFSVGLKSYNQPGEGDIWSMVDRGLSP